LGEPVIIHGTENGHAGRSVSGEIEGKTGFAIE
jgi:hypothetical protein